MPPKNSTQLPKSEPAATQTDYFDGRWQVPILKIQNRQVDWRIFSSKTQATQPTVKTKKSDNIWLFSTMIYSKSTRSDKISTKYGEISINLVRTLSDLTRSHWIQAVSIVPLQLPVWPTQPPPDALSNQSKLKSLPIGSRPGNPQPDLARTIAVLAQNQLVDTHIWFSLVYF